MLKFLKLLHQNFCEGMKKPYNHIRAAKEMRAGLTTKQIDKTLQDSFPASDPPGWY